MKINFVGGRGKMGRIHTPVLEADGHEVFVTGRESRITPVEAAKFCDLTLVAVPIPYTEKTIERVAPHAPAIMDLTSLMTFPLRAMEKHAKKCAEIGSLHPSYGDVESIEGRTVFYCQTPRSGERCRAVVAALERGGARIDKITPREHDLYVGGLAQLARTNILDAYMKLLQRYNVDIDWFYANSPPPTRILLDLIARQATVSNEAIYQSMKEYNPYVKEVGRSLQKCLRSVLRRGMSPREVRRMYGNKILAAAQKSAAKIIDRRV